MQFHDLPIVDSCFTTSQGETFVVIGRGTQGVIVEYIDGRVELLSLSQWANIAQDPLTTPLH